MDKPTISRYLFFLPYIGAVLVIGSLFAPAVSYIIKTIYYPSHALWIWGLYSEIICVNPPSGWACSSTYSLISDPFILVISIILTALIVITGVKTIVKARKYGRDEKYLDNLFIKYGGMEIIFISIWMITVEIFYAITGFKGMGPPFSFWSYFPPHFGVIGIFIGGFIIILGPIIHKILYKQYYYLYD